MQSEPDKKVKILEVVCRSYSDLNEEKYDYYVINCDDREMIYYELFEGSGSNPYVSVSVRPLAKFMAEVH